MKKTFDTLGKDVLKAAAGAVLGMLVSCGLVGLLIQWEILPRDMGGVTAEVLSGAVLFFFCWRAAKKAGKNRLPVTLSVAVLTAAIRFLVKVIAFAEAELQIGWGIGFVVLAAVLAGCLASMKKQYRR